LVWGTMWWQRPGATNIGIASRCPSVVSHRSHSFVAVCHSSRAMKPGDNRERWCSPMSVLMVHSKVKAENVADLEEAVQAMFAAIERAQPAGMRYASCRLSDGVTYVALLELDDGVENPLPALPEFRALQENLPNWIAAPPVPDQVTVI